ncbi:MAG: sterol desaturase family protein [Leptolyngbyaceae cyanobacterium]
MAIPNIQPNFWFYWLVFCGIILTGYFITASSLYWLLYWVKGDKFAVSEVDSQPQHERRQAIAKDIKLSVLSVLFFALGAACFMACYKQGITRVYTQWGLQDLGYITFSYLLVLWLQDTYFYFTHRLFHQPLLFKWFHQGHHLSKPPTPWTFFALEPVEAATQATFLLGITFVIPLHLGVLVAILITMTVWATGNHLGLQVVPFSQTSRWWGRWLIGSTHHLVHHRRYTQHYGLYFTFWDKLLGTQSDRYEAKRLQSLSEF